MGIPLTGSQKAAASLKRLTDLRLSPEAIESGYRTGWLKNHHIAMTSMGNRHRAIITPMYHAIQDQHRLKNRLLWAGTFQRALVEAAVTYNPKSPTIPQSVASVTLRLCLAPWRADPDVIESAWRFPFDVEPGEVSTLEDVVEKASDNALNGKAVARRSGVIACDADILTTSKWPFQLRLDPESAVDMIHSAVTENLPFAQ